MRTKSEKRCPKCEKVLPLSAFYFKPSIKRYASYCKDCSKTISKEDYDAVKKYPNQYTCEKQRKQVFQMMNFLGWIFIKESGRWYKPGVKNPDGTFVGIINKRIREAENEKTGEKPMYS